MANEQAGSERVADLNRGQLYQTVESRLLDCQQHIYDSFILLTIG